MTIRKLAPAGHLVAGAPSDWRVDGDAATVSAVIADLSAVDRDGDEYAPGAFAGASDVLISQWQHGSWQPGLLPVGRGRITEEGNLAVFRGTFLPTDVARQTFETLRALGELVQWSYGLDVLASGPPTRQGARQRLLRLAVHEVSPVLVGAGVGTRTLSTDGPSDPGTEDALRELARSVRIGLEADVRRELLAVRADLQSAA